MTRLGITLGLLLAGWAAQAEAQDGVANGAGFSHSLQQALLADPQAMQQIMELQNDPSIQSILQDEEMMRAIQAGDMEVLSRDGRIMELMGHPTVRSLSSNLDR